MVPRKDDAKEPRASWGLSSALALHDGKVAPLPPVPQVERGMFQGYVTPALGRHTSVPCKSAVGTLARAFVVYWATRPDCITSHNVGKICI